MSVGWRRGRGLISSTALMGLVAAGCGGDANLGISTPEQCGGGKGPQVNGVVRMPDGRVAQVPAALERVANAVVGVAQALSGGVSPVGRGTTVELVELRAEDLRNGTQPPALEFGTTGSNGRYCVNLRADTDRSVCRYLVQVGNRDDRTLTRAFVFGDDDAIDIDYRSEAAVRLILQRIPPAELCDFDLDELRDIYQAVLAVPGTVQGADAEEINAIATTLAAADPGVQAAIAAAGDLPPTAVPTETLPPGSVTATRTATATRPPGTPTATPPPGADTPTPNPTGSRRPTRTPVLPPTFTPTRQGTRTFTATSAPTRTLTAVPTRTVTGIPTGTASATIRPTATRTAIGVPTGTATATRTPTHTAPPAVTATFTATATPGAGLGERVFTIDSTGTFGMSMRSGFFSSGLGGNSIAAKISEGPLVLQAGARAADGKAPLSLKQDGYFKIDVQIGGTVLCVKLIASTSSGFIDCDGGSPLDVELTEAGGAGQPAGVPMPGKGADGGPGGAQLNVQQQIAEMASFDLTCDANTPAFGAPVNLIFTTGTYKAQKGTAKLEKKGENFDCANWTMTDGPGMLGAGVVAYDPRIPGGNGAQVTRLADK
ncbi:MAG: hypothetical protein SF182_21020 [Deltaproteobacteria bacterium]|nr:hypothetical protein [Deltaproteobacteria bacterium]